MRVVAVNRATNHPNLLHNDEYARHVGFSGGLVPGVDVYAYLSRSAVEHFGRGWLDRGAGEVRFLRPVYDGDQLDIEAARGGNEDLAITARCGEEVRAVLTARLAPTVELEPTDVIPVAPVFDPKLKADRKSFHEGMTLGSLAVTMSESACMSQLAEVSEVLHLYRRERIVHPGHLLRFADAILSANVDLPPWMHVGSVIRHHGLVHWNESLTVRARVMAIFVRKRHEFIQLEVLVAGVDDRPRLRVMPYTAIFKPFFRHR